MRIASLLQLSRFSALRRAKSRGVNLAFTAVMATTLVAFLGVALYTGMQAYLQGEIQKAASTAVLAGAAEYYTGSGKPTADPTNASDVADTSFANMLNNSGALKNFKAEITAHSSHDANDSIGLRVKATVGTPFLAAVGINQFAVNAEAAARALKYIPTDFTGPVLMFPPTKMEAILNLEFPLVDNPGTDLYIMQVAQRGYAVEACSESNCYNLVDAAIPIGSSRIVTRSNGNKVIYGSVFIDLGKVGVNKASRLRFTDDGVYDSYILGGNKSFDLIPTPTVIDSVHIFGYSSACPRADYCPVPYGFAPVE